MGPGTFPQSGWMLCLWIGGALTGCAASPDIVERIPPPGMVLIPAGYFQMGANPDSGRGMLEAGVDESPKHRVFLKAYQMDQYEVTVRDYRRFVQSGGHSPPPIWSDTAYPMPEDNHPVVDVSWYDAEAYCQWAGKRLPTEAEWEKAARGTDGRIWPWGNQFDSRKSRTLQEGFKWTEPVENNIRDVSPYGIYGMAGNAMEWTASWYQSYPGSKLRRAAFGHRYRVLRGGAWNVPALPFSRTTNRHGVAPEWDHPSHGFRCAREAI